MLFGSPSKLRSGDWGARINGSASPGDSVQITSKKGTSWVSVVEAVVWSDNQTTLCSLRARTSNSPPSATTYRAKKGVDYCGYPCPVNGHRCTANNPCHDCV